MLGPVLIDTHCHLHLLEAPPEQVVAEAAAEGVGHLVDVGVDLASSRQAADNAARLPQVSATAGVHPHDADGFTDAAAAGMTGSSRRKRPGRSATGGPDRSWTRSARWATRATPCSTGSASVPALAPEWDPGSHSTPRDRTVLAELPVPLPFAVCPGQGPVSLVLRARG
jgi:hypothetical protein